MRQIAKKQKVVVKNGDTLTVHLKNKKIQRYVNSEYEDEIYSFVGNLGNTPYLLFRYQYQSGEVEGFLLVNSRNGHQCNVPGKPILSPDSKRFVTTCVDLEAHYNPNIIAIYRLEKDSCRIEYSNEPSDWGVSKVKWLSNYSIECKKVILMETGLITKGKFILQFKNTLWLEKE